MRAILFSLCLILYHTALIYFLDFDFFCYNRISPKNKKYAEHLRFINRHGKVISLSNINYILARKVQLVKEYLVFL